MEGLIQKLSKTATNCLCFSGILRSFDFVFIFINGTYPLFLENWVNLKCINVFEVESGRQVKGRGAE